MKLIGFTMVKNEEDIIEQFVRHNLQYLDEIYICDHSSKDFTTKILLALKSEGLPIHLFTSSAPGYTQAQTMTLMFQTALSSGGPGIYFALDADEFLNPLINNDAKLIDKFLSLPRNSYCRVPLRNMMVPQGIGDDYFSDVPKSFHQMEVLDNPVIASQKIIFKVDDVEEGKKIFIGQGNHGFGGADFSPTSIDFLNYIHVPIRSATQVFRKFVGGWLANVQTFGKDTTAAYHWRDIFDKICDGRAATNQDIAFPMDLYLFCTRQPGGPVPPKFETVHGSELFHYDLKYNHMRMPGIGLVLKDLESALAKMHGQIESLQRT